MPPVDWLASWDPRVLGATSFGLGAFFGAYVGHRFTLRRDRRSEYNAIVLPIRERLQSINGGDGIKLPTSAELDAMEPLLGWRQSGRVADAIAHCKQQQEQHSDHANGDWTGVHHPSLAPLKLAAARLLAALPIR